jgi:hypothetical protein
MSEESQPNLIDLDLVDKVVELIPQHTWTMVRDTLVANLVDSMTITVIERLCGPGEEPEQAEEILINYYNDATQMAELIQDAFTILGAENTLYILDGLQLDKLPDNAPCSIDPD